MSSKQSFTVTPTRAQARVIKAVAKEMRCQPGELVLALALADLSGYSEPAECLEALHASLHEAIVLRKSPDLEFPLRTVSTITSASENKKMRAKSFKLAKEAAR